ARPSSSPPFPYTTLFRSRRAAAVAAARLPDRGRAPADGARPPEPRGRASARSRPPVAPPRRGAYARRPDGGDRRALAAPRAGPRSEEHTSELQSRENLVC